MLSTKDVALVYETLLSSPGMNDVIKISFSASRKQVLLLSKIIELGLSVKAEGSQTGIVGVIETAAVEELQGLSGDLLKKAGLTEMNDKLNGLQSK